MSQFSLRHNVDRYQCFVVRANIARFTNLLSTTVDETNRRMLLSLLAQEQAKLRALSPGEAEDNDPGSFGSQSPRR